MYVYENVNVQGQRVNREQKDSRLEMLPNWVRVQGPSDADEQARAAADLERSAAEQKSIEEAAAHRATHATLYHDQAQQVAAASATPPANPDAPNQTPSHTGRGGTPGEALLKRRQTGLRASPLTPAQMQEKADRDSLAAQQSGVLARAHGKASLDDVDLSPGQTTETSIYTDDEVADANADDPEAGSEPAAGSGGDAEDQGDGELEPPAKSAGKDAWIAHACAVEHARGDARERSDEEIGGLTVKQLQQHYG